MKCRNVLAMIIPVDFVRFGVMERVIIYLYICLSDFGVRSSSQ